MTGRWNAEPSADFLKRLGKSSHELGNTSGDANCPDMWELTNGDIAIIGTELSAAYRGRLPEGGSWAIGPRAGIAASRQRHSRPAANVCQSSSTSALATRP